MTLTLTTRKRTSSVDRFADADCGDGLLLLLELDDDNDPTDKLLLVDEGVLDGGSARDSGAALLLLREFDIDDEETNELDELRLNGLADVDCGAGLLLLLELDAADKLKVKLLLVDWEVPDERAALDLDSTLLLSAVHA